MKLVSTSSASLTWPVLSRRLNPYCFSNSAAFFLFSASAATFLRYMPVMLWARSAPMP